MNPKLMLCHSATARVKRVSNFLTHFKVVRTLTLTAKQEKNTRETRAKWSDWDDFSLAAAIPYFRARAHSNSTLFSSFTEYTCHATWRENLTTFIIATHASTKHGVCISFRQQQSTDSAQLFIGDSCYRENQGLDNISDHPITLANLTNVGRKSNECYGEIQCA